jgi:hypothetical protein
VIHFASVASIIHSPPKVACAANEDQKCRLKSVIRRVFTPQDRPANPTNHRAMPFDQSGKGQIAGPVAQVEKSLEQLPVGQPNGCPGVEEQFHVSTRGYLLSLRHRAGLLPGRLELPWSE